MYIDHPAFEKPEDKNAKIWRYMDFTQFVSLLDMNTLYFSRLDFLSDPYEGSLPLANINKRNKGFTEETIKLYKSIFPSFDYDEYMKQYIKRSSWTKQEERKLFFINFWHLNEYESHAMWNQYSKNGGIAIQSTFDKLCNSLSKIDRTIWIGKVKYIDYRTEAIPEDNTLKPLLHKRKSFEHERELRAIVQPLDPGLKIPYDYADAIEEILKKQGQSTRGIYLGVDLETLIERIYVSPLAEDWLVNLVKSIIRKYRLDKEVEFSSLADNSPLF
ncbi:MAG: hypothetical protein ABR985_16770 [Methanotrichaceae archaeon]|jgi:hypothetical protein